MISVRNTYSEEENTVIFNILKKIVGSSFSTLKIAAIYAPEAGIDRNCLLIKYKNKYIFLSKPKMKVEDLKLSLFSGNRMLRSFSTKESSEVLQYLYTNKYIDLFFDQANTEPQEQLYI